MHKILFLGKLPPPYIGPAIACQIIINSNLKDEFRIIHLNTSDHRDINTLAKFDFTNFYLAFKHYFLLFYYLIKHNPQIVYIPAGQTTVSFLRDSVFILGAKLFRKKVVCHLRGGNFKNWYNSTSVLTKWWVRFVQRKVDAQIVLGNNLKPLFNWLMPENRIFVVPNGGNFPHVQFKNTSEKIRVLFLANFIKTKGILDVLDAASIVCKQKTNVEFVFAGSWRDQEVKHYFEQFDKTNINLTIAGAVKGDSKLQLYAESDIFVFPTYYPNEGHPWVIIEAMAAGLPVISTDHAAITESVIDGINGFIVEPRNPQQIAEKIQYLIDNTEIRLQMGKESRRLYEENFTEEKMVERLSNVFNTLLQNA